MVKSSFANQANAHTGFSLQRGAAPHGPQPTGCGGKAGLTSGKGCGVVSYTALRGGKRSRKRKRKHRKRKKRNSRRRCGGSPANLLEPKKGMRQMLTRGKNASRGLSLSEKRTISGAGLFGYSKSKKNLIDIAPSLQGNDGLDPSVKTGGGYGYTRATAAQSFGPHGLGQGYHLKGTLPTTGYKNCGIIPNFKMGAAVNYVGTKTIQKGAGPAKFPSNQSLKLMSTDGQNQMPAASYGYTTGKNASIFAPGHAQVTNLSNNKQQCHLSGGRKKKGGRGLVSHLFGEVANFPGKVSSDANNLIGNSFLDVHAASGGRRTKRRKRKHSKKRRKRKHRRSRKRRRVKRRKRRTKKQRGGYAQYQSNYPLTWTQQTPDGRAGGTWEGQLASPPTYSRTNICHNNYNHYTGKNTPSPILDQAVMTTKRT